MLIANDFNIKNIISINAKIIADIIIPVIATPSRGQVGTKKQKPQPIKGMGHNPLNIHKILNTI